MRITIAALFIHSYIAVVMPCSSFRGFVTVSHNRTIHALEGCPFKLYCVAFSDSSAIDFRWNAKESKRFVNIERSDEGLYISTATFLKMNKSDDGIYTCRIRNSKMVTNIMYKVKVNIRNQDKRCHPTWKPASLMDEQNPWVFEPPETKPIPIKKSSILKCLPKSLNEFQSLNWITPNSTEMDRGYEDENFKVCCDGSLMIKSMAADLIGLYHCVVSPTLNFTSDVYIPMPVKISTLPKFYKTYVGCSFKIQCMAAGDQQLELKLKVPKNSNHKGGMSTFSSWFTTYFIYEKRKAELNDSGIYECIAENPFGPRQRTQIEISIINKNWFQVDCPQVVIPIQNVVPYKRPFMDKEELSFSNDGISISFNTWHFLLHFICALVILTFSLQRK